MDPTTKTKKRMFSAPLLRRSATASSAAAASAASRIRSNLSTVTKLPTALKRSSTNIVNSPSDDDKDHVDRAPACTASSSSAESTVKIEEAKTTPRIFSIPSLKHIKVVSKEKPHPESVPECVEDSPEDQPESSNSDNDNDNNNTTTSNSDNDNNDNNNTTSNSDNDNTTTISNSDNNNNNNTTTNNNNNNNSEEETESTSETHRSAIGNASRFVRGMPTMLRRAVSSHHILDASGMTRKKLSDTSADSRPRKDSSENEPETERTSLLLMLQVPQTRRHSQVPLMAASEDW